MQLGYQLSSSDSGVNVLWTKIEGPLGAVKLALGRPFLTIFKNF